MKERFKQIREYYCLSQAEFAQRIHKSAGFVSYVETDRCRVTESTIDAICEAFQVERTWLTTGEGEMFDSPEEHNKVDKAEVGGRVRAVRKWVGLTQEKFAKRIGYSKMQVHSVERGNVIPSNQFLEKIVSEFGVNASWIFTGVGIMMDQNRKLDDRLIRWLNEHPKVIEELWKRSGLEDETWNSHGE